MPAGFSDLPNELTREVLEYLYLGTPLALFSRMRRVCHRFKVIHDEVVSEYRYPKAYFIEKESDDGNNDQPVETHLPNDVARLHRALYMLDISVHLDLDTQTPLFGAVLREGYVERVYSRDHHPSPEVAVTSTPMWRENLTCAPVESVMLDASRLVNLDPGTELWKIEKTQENSALTVEDFFTELSLKVLELNFDEFQSIAYGRLRFKGLKWLHGDTFTFEVTDQMCYVE